MRYFYWGLTALIAIIIACFAVSNRTAVDLEFWPLPLALSVPLYLVVLVVLLLGLAVGWFAGWAGSWRVRRERRRHARRIEELERDLGRLHAASSDAATGKSLVQAG
ncbi:MAG TPA: lipopolysaccharide assembly protein LapA domain-containing protein [Aliidongia sp.]|nr:lipopolysaccharide assembly protein LapA domain-containing protein [Aliidongia sp.]